MPARRPSPRQPEHASEMRRRETRVQHPEHTARESARRHTFAAAALGTTPFTTTRPAGVVASSSPSGPARAKVATYAVPSSESSSSKVGSDAASTSASATARGAGSGVDRSTTSCFAPSGAWNSSASGVKNSTRIKPASGYLCAPHVSATMAAGTASDTHPSMSSPLPAA